MIKLWGLFGWREAFRAGVYAYFENDVTGERRARRWSADGYSPLDRAWVSGLKP